MPELSADASVAQSAFRVGAIEKRYDMIDKFSINTETFMIHWGWSQCYGYLPRGVDPRQILKPGFTFWAVVTPLVLGESTTKNMTIECRACGERSYTYYGFRSGPTCDPDDWHKFRSDEPETTEGVVQTFEGGTREPMENLMRNFMGTPVSLPPQRKRWWKEPKLWRRIQVAVEESMDALLSLQHGC